LEKKLPHSRPSLATLWIAAIVASAGCGTSKPGADADAAPVSDGAAVDVTAIADADAMAGDADAGAVDADATVDTDAALDADAAGDADAADVADAGDASDGGDGPGAIVVVDARGDVPDPVSPPVDCTAEPQRCALCTGRYEETQARESQLIRGSWQYNPGGPYVHLPVSGYPCAAFAYDGDVRPPMRDEHWVPAPNGDSIAFSADSTLPRSEYRDVQFRYFRSLVFVPADFNVAAFNVTVTGVDDSVRVILFNSKYPEGVSPKDVGPTDPVVGACAGNGDHDWDLVDYVKAGEVNIVLLIHADMNPSTSMLQKVEVKVNGAGISLFHCDVRGDAGVITGPSDDDGGSPADATDADPTDADTSDANDAGVDAATAS
jgi:hypothetical protein